MHNNSRLTPHSRALAIRQIRREGRTISAVAREHGVSNKCIRNWLHRYQQQGAGGLQNRSSRPHNIRAQTPQATRNEICALRKANIAGNRVAGLTGCSPATVSRILRSAKLSRARDIAPAQPVIRYQREIAGELIHLDIKPLAAFWRPGHKLTGDRTIKSSGAGMQYLHIAIDDASRFADSRIYPDQRAASAVDFLRRCVDFYRAIGVCIREVMTDNGSCYIARDFAAACSALDIRHIRTRPYRPQTNGKAERFIQTALREWAHARLYQSSEQRNAALPHWLHNYNWHRAHRALGGVSPAQSLQLNWDNVLKSHN